MSYRRTRHLAWRKILEETVVIDLKSRQALAVNDSGAWILDALDRPRTSAALARGLSAAAATGSDDVERFLEQLVRGGLAEPSSDVSDATELPPPPVPGEAPRILWQEPLEAVVHASPSMNIGEPTCNQ